MEVLERLRFMKEMCDVLAARMEAATPPNSEDQKHYAKLSRFLADAQLPTAEYSAMASAFLS